MCALTSRDPKARPSTWVIIQTRTLATSLALIIEGISRELVQYGIMISNLAQTVATEKAMVVGLARHLLEVLGTTKLQACKDNFGTFLNDSEAAGPPDASSASATALNHSEAADPPAASSASASVAEHTLPQFVITELLKGHQCRCQQCEPEVLQSITAKVKTEIQAEMQNNIEEEERELLRCEFRAKELFCQKFSY